MVAVGARFGALVSLVLVLGCSSGPAAAPECPSGFVAAGSACVPEVGVIKGAAVFGDQTAHGGILITMPGFDRSATTDETGSFTITNVPPGSYGLEARFPAYQKAVASTVTVTHGATTQVPPMVLTRESPAALAASVKGVIQLTGALSSGGVLVFLEGTTLAAFTAANGAFTFERVPAGMYRLVATSSGYVSASVASVTVPTTGMVDVGTLVMAPVGVTTGTVSARVQLAGAATGNAGISVALSGTSYLGTTDDDGNVTLSGVLPGTYELAAIRPGYDRGTTQGVVVTAGQATTVPPLSLALTAVSGTPGTISGTARMLGFTTQVGITATLRGGSLTAPLTAMTNTIGGYQFTNVTTGAYELTFTATGYQPTVVPNVLSAPGTVRVTDAMLYRSRKIDERRMAQARVISTGPWAVGTFDEPNPTTWLYSATADQFRTALPKQARLLTANDEGTFATLETGFEFYRLDLSTAVSTAVTPAPDANLGFQYWVPAPGYTVYTGPAGELFSLPARSATAQLFAERPCPLANLSVESEPLPGNLPDAWTLVSGFYDCGGNPTNLRGFWALDQGQGVPLAHQLEVGPSPAAYVLTLEYANPAGSGGNRILKRTTVSPFGIATLASDVLGLFVSPDQAWATVVHSLNGTTGRRSISRLVPASGGLVSLAPNVLGLDYLPGGTSAVTSPGAPGVVEPRLHLRLDTGVVTQACPTAKYSIRDDQYLYCLSGAGPYVLTAFNFATATSQTLSSAATSLDKAADGAVTWFEGTTLKGQDLAQTGPANIVCAYGTITRHLSQGTWLGDCAPGEAGLARWTVVSLASGVSRDLLPTPNQGASLRSIVTERARGVVAHYDAVDFNDCGAARCVVALDLRSNGRTIVQGALGFTARASGGEAASLQGGGLSQLVRFSGAGDPAFVTVADGLLGPGAENVLFASAGGRFVLTTLALVDLQTATVIGSCTENVVALGSSGEFVCRSSTGLQLIRLSQGTMTTLASDMATFRVAGNAVLFLNGGVLSRYQAGQGSAAVIGSPSVEMLNLGTRTYFRTGTNPTAVLRALDNTTGTLTTVLQDASLRVTFLTNDTALLFANPSATAGDAYVVNGTTGAVQNLNARMRLDLSLTTSVTGRLAFNGENSAGAVRTFVGRRDGTGVRELGGEPSTFNFSEDGSRLFFLSNGLWWVEDPSGGPSLAIDTSGIESISLSRNGRFLIYTSWALGYPAALRNGTYRLDLP